MSANVKEAIEEISNEIEEDKKLEQELLGPREPSLTPIIPTTLNINLLDPRPRKLSHFSCTKSI